MRLSTGLTSALFGMGLVFALAAGTGSTLTNAQSAASVNCPTDVFLDVSEGSAGDGYPAAQLSVRCTDDTLVIDSNGMINYEFVAITPNALSEQDYTWEIPLTPVVAEETTSIALLGPVAVAINGLPIYGPNEAQDLGFGDPFLDQLLDTCNGHTAPGGVYHYHARPECLLTTETEAEAVGYVLGYAFDGYPILAPYVCTDAACTEVTELQSSWQRTTDVTSAWDAHEYVEGSGDLDECNGMTSADGSYAYYATDSFPYLLACYRGEVDPSVTQSTMPQGMGGQPPAGGQGGQPPAGGQGGQPPAGGQGGQPPAPGTRHPSGEWRLSLHI